MDTGLPKGYVKPRGRHRPHLRSTAVADAVRVSDATCNARNRSMQTPKGGGVRERMLDTA
jgi:hypothetical protein